VHLEKKKMTLTYLKVYQCKLCSVKPSQTCIRF